MKNTSISERFDKEFNIKEIDGSYIDIDINKVKAFLTSELKDLSEQVEREKNRNYAELMEEVIEVSSYKEGLDFVLQLIANKINK